MSKENVVRKPSVKSPHTLYDVLRALGMASKRSRTRMVLEDWFVLWRLEELGEKRLSFDEQRFVMLAVRDPKAFPWPEWWGTEAAR